MFNSFNNPYSQAAKGFLGQGQNRSSFPTDPNLSLDQYPDVTSHFEDAKYGMYRNLLNTHHWNTPEGITGLFREKMHPKGPWDLASQPQFPGITPEGKTEYAKLNDHVVTGDFLNHHMLGHGLAGAGLSLTSEDPEKRVSPKQFPTGIWDSDAVHSGYQKYMGDPGWRDGLQNTRYLANKPSSGFGDNGRTAFEFMEGPSDQDSKFGSRTYQNLKNAAEATGAFFLGANGIKSFDVNRRHPRATNWGESFGTGYGNAEQAAKDFPYDPDFPPPSSPGKRGRFRR